MKGFIAAAILVCASAGAFSQTDTTATDTSATPASTAASDVVRRAVFCTAVTDHEPVDTITTLAAPASSITFFTEVVGLEGQTITHRWMHGGQTMAEVSIAVGANRWRCYSTKTLAPGLTGAWSVDVVGSDGTVLGSSTFTYTAE